MNTLVIIGITLVVGIVVGRIWAKHSFRKVVTPLVATAKQIEQENGSLRSSNQAAHNRIQYFEPLNRALSEALDVLHQRSGCTNGDEGIDHTKKHPEGYTPERQAEDARLEAEAKAKAKAKAKQKAEEDAKKREEREERAKRNRSSSSYSGGNAAAMTVIASDTSSSFSCDTSSSSCDAGGF